MPMIVANQFPIIDPGGQRLAVVAECPGIEESTYQRCSRGHGFALQYWEDKRLQTRDRCPVPECCSRDFAPCPTPFVGWSGRLLDDVLREAGLPRERVFVGNVSQTTQTADELADPANPHVAAGLAVLRTDLTAFRPNVVLCLGNTALRAFHRDAGATVTNWRGSLFSSTFLSGGGGHKASPLETEGGSGAVTPVLLPPPVPFCGGISVEGLQVGRSLRANSLFEEQCPASEQRDTANATTRRETAASGNLPTTEYLSGGTHSDNPPGKGLVGAVTACSPVSSPPTLPHDPFPVLGTKPVTPKCAASDTNEIGRTGVANTPTGASLTDATGPFSTALPTGTTPPAGVASPLSPPNVVDRVYSTYVVPVPLKCTTSFHPAAVLRTPGWTALFRYDVARAVAEAATPVLTPPVRTFVTTASANTIVEFLDLLRERQQPVGTDLEGYATTGMTDCSFATSPSFVLWVPLKHLDGSPWWPPITEQRIMTALRAVLEDPAVPKVCHNGLYEGFVLWWAHGITLRGLVDDTMLMWHELYAELDKGLETPVSILTTQPYWGTSKDATTDEERAIYNCTDSAVTLEIADVMAPMLDDCQRAHYEFNVSLLAPCLWQMLRGIRYDTVARDRLVAELQHDVYELQGELDELAGIAPPTFAEVAAVVALKRKLPTVVDWPDIVVAAKPLWAKGGRAKRVVEMARRAQPVAPVEAPA